MKSFLAILVVGGFVGFCEVHGWKMWVLIALIVLYGSFERIEAKNK